jgi:hypothetical protein
MAEMKEEAVKKRLLAQSNSSFCTCLPSGNQVDDLPLASRWISQGRACMCGTRRVLSSGEVCEAKMLVNLIFSVFHHTEASIELTSARNERRALNRQPGFRSGDTYRRTAFVKILHGYSLSN